MVSSERQVIPLYECDTAGKRKGKTTEGRACGSLFIYANQYIIRNVIWSFIIIKPEILYEEY